MIRPFNLNQWIDEHKDALRPPVGNKQVYTDTEDFIVMVVGGPNGRSDYHWEEGEELFYQIKGDIQVKIINSDGQRETIDIRAGEMFLLPPRIPHSPQRGADTIGLVIERKRHEGEIDKLMWFCESCDQLIYEGAFPLKDIGTQIKTAIEAYQSNPDHKICPSCGHVN